MGNDRPCGFPQCGGGSTEHQRITIGWNTVGNIAVRLERHYSTNSRGQGVGTYYDWQTCRGKDRDAYRRAQDKARKLLASNGRPIYDGCNDMAEIRDCVGRRFKQDKPRSAALAPPADKHENAPET